MFRGLKKLSGAALELFNESLYGSIKEQLRKELIITFINDRNGDVVDRELMRDVVQCYVVQGCVGAEPKREASKYFWEGWRTLAFYQSEFEEQFLYYASLEYQEKAKLWIAKCTIADYLHKVVDAFAYEENNN